ncbi:MAG: urea ABC transporter substrate-binding protein [Gammaproteobacteria bacterium]|nr:urea ABC transporter substrate-binding protein [Gammaproteobacteria bacterium]
MNVLRCLFSKRYKYLIRLIIIAPLLLVLSCQEQDQTVKIGIVHSLTGTMSNSEKPVVDSLLLAVEEVNQNGGVLGQQVEAIVVDGQSDPAVFAQAVEKLVTEQDVSAIFGCWTSSCRKAVKPIVEKYNNLLFYSVQFEGLETSKNIIYLGSAPNQQLIPGVSWMLKTFGSPLYLVGSDYVFPRAANLIIRNMVYMKENRLVGEKYIPLGSLDMEKIISDIKKKNPSGIINTINGDSNIAFFRALKDQNLTHIPIMSFSLSETEINKIGGNLFDNSFITVNYLASSKHKGNSDFIKKFQQKYGASHSVGSVMAMSYIAVKLWANTVNEINSKQVDHIRKAISNKSINGPAGVISVDPESKYIWQTIYIGKLQKSGLVEQVWSSEKPIRPKPFPMAHSQDSWLRALKKIETKLAK